MADLLLSRLEGEPLPMESDLVDAVNPGRFLVRPPVGKGPEEAASA
jgi:tRNA 5-methylaminomethyl-2-thiouridine biosynthesis bifunctional protein